MAASDSVFAAILGRTEGLDRPFVVGPRPATYGDLLAGADRIGTALADAGCRRGQRVGVCLDQGLEYVAGLLGVWRAGGVSVLLSPDWTDHEKDRVLQHSESSYALTDSPGLAGDACDSSAPIQGLDCFVERNAVDETESAAPGDAVIIYTSGTTGHPKGVVLGDSAVSANVRGVADYLELDTRDGSPIFTPSCYAYSLSQNLTHALAGARIFPVPSGLLFPLEILQGVAEHRLTGISAIPTAFRILCDLDAGEGLDFDSVRYLMSGGQALDVRLTGLLSSVFPNARIVNMYGCTENSPRISYHWVEGTGATDTSGFFPVGLPVNGTRIRIEGDGGGEAATDEVGEILIGGESLMRCYWKDPDATAGRLQDGWFHTRDLGYRDEGGRLHLRGRRTSIINIGNEKVSPEEVERVLLEIPEVEEAAVYGIPDPLLGEAVHARVVPAEGARVQVADLQRHCRERVSGYKVPRRILMVAALPRTQYGKVDRGALADESDAPLRSD